MIHCCGREAVQITRSQYNYSNKILDILKEVKKKFNINVIYYTLKILCKFSHRDNGVTKDPDENDYLLVFDYAKNGDLHNYLSKNFKYITWKDKIYSLYDISDG